MDPQKLSQLDPKLREAYQRVMGTPTSQAQTPPPAGGQTSPTHDSVPAPTPTPTPEPKPISPEPTPPMQEPPVPKGQPAIPQSEPPPAGGPTPESAMPQKPTVQPTNFDQMNSEVAASPSQNFAQPAPMAQTQTTAVKKKNHLMPILIGVAGLIFVAIYTLFWTKIFNFKLPFLP